MVLTMSLYDNYLFLNASSGIYIALFIVFYNIIVCVCVAVASVLALADSVNSVHLSQAVSTSTPQTHDTTQAHSAVHKTNTMHVACAARSGTGW